MTQEQITKTPFILSLDHVLYGFSESERTPEMILEGFEKSWNDLKKKQSLFKHLVAIEINPELLKENLKNMKFLALRNIVSRQMKERRYFDLKSPFKHTCPKCNGSGEIYEFAKEEVPCRTCLGEKTIMIKCTKCNDEGKFFNGKEHVDCKFCKGTKFRKVKCFKCLGTGKSSKLVLTHNITSTTRCPECDGLGFIEPKKKTTPKLPNPVIKVEDMKGLVELIKETPDEKIDNTVVPDQPLS